MDKKIQLADQGLALNSLLLENKQLSLKAENLEMMIYDEPMIYTSDIEK